MNKQELLEEAKRRYPIGCKIDQRTAYDGNGHIHTIKNYECTYNMRTSFAIGDVGVYNPISNKWAEIVQLPQIMCEIW